MTTALVKIPWGSGILTAPWPPLLSFPLPVPFPRPRGLLPHIPFPGSSPPFRHSPPCGVPASLVLILQGDNAPCHGSNKAIIIQGSSRTDHIHPIYPLVKWLNLSNPKPEGPVTAKLIRPRTARRLICRPPPIESKARASQGRTLIRPMPHDPLSFRFPNYRGQQSWTILQKHKRYQITKKPERVSSSALCHRWVNDDLGALLPPWLE